MNKLWLLNQIEQQDEIVVRGEACSGELGQTLRVLVWNIYKAKREGWLDEFKKLSEDRDLVLVQEAVSNTPIDAYYDASNQHEWVMGCSFQNPKTKIITGVQTGSLAKADKVVLHRSNFAEPIAQTQKLLLETHYRVRGQSTSLMVLNIHAINFVGTRKYADQIEQIEAVLQSHTGPVLLAGDFNTWNTKRMTVLHKCASEAGLFEASMTRERKALHLNKHLDHVFYRGLCLNSVESIGHITTSDHAPIKATFLIQ